ncbi:hypothetical protein AND_007777 [Anopheles darlingi]|uniref:HTH CENPB-type domain-containing protein n=1 Tax=Anopheles darlingi TaxID=43151 RepID=W5JCP4_ANODA|nr:hypothetical protein AND_007777 [Anopheles darlingi]
MGKIIGFCNETTQLGDKTAEDEKNSIERAMVRYVEIRKRKGLPLRRKLFRKRALDHANAHGLTKFQISHSWITQFARENNVIFIKQKVHPASVERDTDSVPGSGEESVYAADDPYRAENDNDMTTEESGCGKSELLERIAQFAPKDVFYVDELLVAVGGGEDIRSRQQLNSLFATNMDGSIKLPLMVFGDSIQQNNLHEMGQLPVVCLKQKTTISTQEALRQWLHMLDHMFSRIAKKVLMIIREATIAGSVISQTKYSSLALLILPAKEQMIEKPLRQGITGTLNACYDHIVKSSNSSRLRWSLHLKSRCSHCTAAGRRI